MDMLKASIRDMKRSDIVAKKGGGSVDYSTSKAKPRSKPKPPEDMGAVARGNRMSKMEAAAKKAMMASKNKTTPASARDGFFGKKMIERKAGGSLKEVPSDNSGLKKLPANVRNKMGYKKAGGSMKKKSYKAGTGKGTVAKPRGVGCAMRGFGRAMGK